MSRTKGLAAAVGESVSIPGMAHKFVAIWPRILWAIPGMLTLSPTAAAHATTNDGCGG